jgi:CubicO group peptidase (beta-lactamase class C family)
MVLSVTFVGLSIKARSAFSAAPALQHRRDYATPPDVPQWRRTERRAHLSRTIIETMLRNRQGPVGRRGQCTVAFGVVTERPGEGGEGSPGTFDWGGYFNTQYFADPKEQLIGVLMKQTQGTTTDDTGWQFRLLVGQCVDD